MSAEETKKNPKFTGFWEENNLPIKKGDIVTILKGTVIKTTCPCPEDKRKIAGRTYKVKVNHTLGGWEDRKYDPTNPKANAQGIVATPMASPSVRWPGGGGYWYEVDLNDIPEANVEKEPKEEV